MSGSAFRTSCALEFGHLTASQSPELDRRINVRPRRLAQDILDLRSRTSWVPRFEHPHPPNPCLLNSTEGSTLGPGGWHRICRVLLFEHLVHWNSDISRRHSLLNLTKGSTLGPGGWLRISWISGLEHPGSPDLNILTPPQSLSLELDGRVNVRPRRLAQDMSGSAFRTSCALEFGHLTASQSPELDERINVRPRRLAQDILDLRSRTSWVPRFEHPHPPPIPVS